MNSATEFSIAFLETQPGGAARVLDQISPGDAASFLENVPEPVVAGVLERMQFARAAAVLQLLTPQRSATLLLQMPSTARTVILRALPERSRDAALSALSRRDRAAMRRYLTYAPGTVGAWMDAPKVSFAPDTTVKDCLERVRHLGERAGFLIFVVDAERRLRGCVEVDQLLSASDNTPLEDVVRSEVIPLSPQMSLTAVVSLPAWDRSLSLPVVDRSRRLVGVLPFDSVREGLVVDRVSSGNLQVNLLLVHMAEAFVASASGLARVATAEPARIRPSSGRER